MNGKHNKALTPIARKLRKDMTREERHLWYDFLREYPIRFLRQKVIGSYVVDFYCAAAKLVVELDGSQLTRRRALLTTRRARSSCKNMICGCCGLPTTM